MLKSKLTYKEFEEHCRTIIKATSIEANEDIEVKHRRIARAKKDYKFFFEYYFPMYAKFPCAKFHIDLANAIKRDKTFKGLLEAFRGSAKSTHSNIGIPLWLKISGEMKFMMLVGQTDEKANRLLAGVQAQLMSNQRFINDFGEQFSYGDWAEGEFATKDGCAFFALGLGQSPRGTRKDEHRPDFIVMDDCDSKKLSKNQRLVKEVVEWTLDDLMGCFDIGNERFLVLNNRISKNSIMATLHKMMVEQKNKLTRWYYMRINAVDSKGEPTWPEKYTKAYWYQKKHSMAMRSWEREYMNNPIEEGTVFNEQWIKWTKILPLREYERLVVYVDPSFKDTVHSDYKAVKFWGRKGRELHLIDAFVRQTSIATMVSYMYDLYERIPKDVVADFWMESNFLQDLIFDAFADEGDIRGYQLPIRGDNRKKADKYSRIEATSPLYERGFIHYNEAKKMDPDFATSIEQLLAIEPGSKTADDSPDADEGAINLLMNNFRASNTHAIIGEREHRHNW